MSDVDKELEVKTFYLLDQEGDDIDALEGVLEMSYEISDEVTEGDELPEDASQFKITVEKIS